MAKKKLEDEKLFELTLLDDCLERFTKIGQRQPLPNQHFYKEASEIITEAIEAVRVDSYNKGHAVGMIEGRAEGMAQALQEEETVADNTNI